MKAFLLAAGLGTRLRPITESIPKCLVPIGGKPLMAYWFDLFYKHGITDVLVNLHHLPDKVRAFVKNYRIPLNVHLVYEEHLLGSGGTLLANKAWVNDDQEFLIAYGDNLTNANLSKLVAFHREHRPVVTMAVFKTDRPKECGIVTVDENNTIIHFEEKPPHPQSNLANAGLFVASKDIFDFFPEKFSGNVLDLGFHVLPNLIGKMKAYVLEDYLLDIGNLERYKKAQEDIRELNF